MKRCALALCLLLAGCGTTTTETVTVATPPKPPASVPHEGFAVRGQCGIERWAVKTLTDPAALTVNMTPRPTTIKELASEQAPKDPTDRVPGAETNTFTLTNVTLSSFKQEADSDVHVVVNDGTRHMIVEFPAAVCDTQAAKLNQQRMAAARAAFVKACGQPAGSYQTIHGRATITGVGFFDRIHGQRGVAPNGIELHPVLAFRGTCG